MRFKELQISAEVKRAIADLGFDEMFPIQEQSLLPMLNGRNVIGQAKTGTGKTACFGVPMIEKVDPSAGKVQGLVLAPTRELAQQITDDINNYAKYTKVRRRRLRGPVQRPQERCTDSRRDAGEAHRPHEAWHPRPEGPENGRPRRGG
jgi:ATP-dependent RNA helicase DeaD